MENNFSELFYNLTIRPARGFNQAKERKPWIFLVAIVILAEISTATGASLFVSSFTGVGRIAFFSNLLLIIACLTFFWVINVGILHFFAEVWGKRGKAIDLFLTLGLALFPFIFFSPFSLIVEGLGRGRIFFQFISIVILLVWSFSLALAAIKEVYSSSTFEALLIVLTPIILFIVLSAVIPLGLILLTVISLPL